MSWQILITLSILLYSVNSLLHRTLMKNEDSSPYAQATLFPFLVGMFSFVVLMFRGGFKSHLTLNILPLYLLLTLLTALGMISTFKGIKAVEASKHTILSTSSKIWSILGAVVILQETLTLNKFLGATLILIGVVVVGWKKQRFNLNAGSIYVLLAAFFFGTGEILSFFILRDFEVFSFLVYASFMISVTLMLARPKVIKEMSFYLKPKMALNVLFSSFNDTAANLLGFTAYQVGRNAIQLAPLGSMQTIITVLFALIILKERDNALQKLLGASIAAVGTILLL